MTGVGSLQLTTILPALGVAWALKAGGVAVTTFKTMGRIMSISSWLRMWQCQTYSQPKSYMMLVTGSGLASPVCQSTLLKPIPESSGIEGFSGRRLLAMPKGSAGARGLTATTVSMSGLILTVSFHPSSFGSGSRIWPSQPTRFTTCTSKI